MELADKLRDAVPEKQARFRRNVVSLGVVAAAWVQVSVVPQNVQKLMIFIPTCSESGWSGPGVGQNVIALVCGRTACDGSSEEGAGPGGWKKQQTE